MHQLYTDTLTEIEDTPPEYNHSFRETRYERLRRHQRLSYRRWLRAFVYDVLTLMREARTPLIGFVLVLLSGTIYWTTIYEEVDYTLGAALFETVRMLALEHSRDFPPDLLGKLLFFAIPGFGLAFVFQGVLDFGRLLLDKSGRLEDWQISQARTYQQHIVVCGLGRVSYRVVLQLLEAGYDVVVVEQDWHSEFVNETLALRVPVIRGDARDSRVLRQAGLRRARGLVSAIDNDLLNIEIALAAQRLNPRVQLVMRIFNERLDYNLEKSKFGTNTAFSSSMLAAPTLAAAAVCRGIVYALPLPNAMLGISELTVTQGGRLDTLAYKIEQEFNVQIIAYTGESPCGESCWRHRVRPDTRLYGGDRVLLLGTLHALGDAWQHSSTRNKIMTTLGIDIKQHPTDQHNTVIVCGLGKVGYRVVQVLRQMTPAPDLVVICDEETTRDNFMEQVEALGVRLIRGDARTAETLLAAGLERAYSVAAVTSDNLSNLQICLTARHLRSDVHLVLRVFSDVLAEQLEGMFGIHTAFSTSALAAPTLAAAAVVPGTAYAISAGDRLLSTVRLVVRPGDEFEGQRIHELRERHAMLVVALRRGSSYHLMPGDPAEPGKLFGAPLCAGDDVILLAEIHTVARLRQRDARTEQAAPRTTRRLPPLPEQTAMPEPPSGPAPMTTLDTVTSDSVSRFDTAPLSDSISEVRPTAPEAPDETQQLLEKLLQNGATIDTRKK